MATQRIGQQQASVLDKFNQAAAEGKLPNAVAAKQKEQAKIDAQQQEVASQEGQLPQTVAPELQPQDQAIPAEALTQAPQPVPTPQQQPVSDLTGRTKLEAAQLATQLEARKAERRVREEEAAVTGLFGEISTEAAFRREKEIEAGLDEKLAMLNDLTTQQIQNDLLGARDLMAIEAGAIGTRMSPGNLQRRLSVKDRENAIRAMTIAAQAAQAQGLVSAAQAKIDSAVEAKYEPLKAQLDMRKWMLGRADKFAEGKQKEKFQLQMKDIEKQEREIAEVTTLSQNVIKNGAPQRIIDAVLGLPEDATRDQLLGIPGIQPYLLSQGERLDLQIKRTSLAKASLALRQARGEVDGIEDPKLAEGSRVRAEKQRSIIESLRANKAGLQAVVGPNFLARGASITGGAPLTLGGLFGQSAEFKSDINQLMSVETLNNLIDIKQQGATFGNLSDGERMEVAQAASRISAAANRKKDGRIKSVSMSEADFLEELNTLQRNAERSVVRSGGEMTPDMLIFQDEAAQMGSFDADGNFVFQEMDTTGFSNDEFFNIN